MDTDILIKALKQYRKKSKDKLVSINIYDENECSLIAGDGQTLQSFFTLEDLLVEIVPCKVCNGTGIIHYPLEWSVQDEQGRSHTFREEHESICEECEGTKYKI